MTTCEQFEESYTDYVCNLLDSREIAPIERHLRECPDCAQEVETLKTVLSLTDEAEAAIQIPTWALENIEMKVYKRLAAESETSGRETFLLRLLRLFSVRPSASNENPFLRGLSPLSGRGFTWIWRGAVGGCTLAAGLLISVALFDGDQPQNAPLSMIKAQSPSERIAQYMQQEIQRNLEDALVTKHLRNDDWEATSQFRMLREQAQGTRWAAMANQQLQVAHVTLK